MEQDATAASWYREAAQIWPDLAPAHYGLAQMLAAEGRVLARQGQEAQAKERFDQAVVALEKVGWG